MNKKYLVGAIVLVGLIVVGARAGLMKSSTTLDTKETEEKSIDDVTVTTDQGTWSTSDKLPNDFPADVPVYPGSTVQGSLAAGQDTSSEGHYVGLQTADSVDDVAKWYKGEIAKQGWKIQADATVNGTSVLSAEKSGRIATVTIATESGKTIIALVVANK